MLVVHAAFWVVALVLIGSGAAKIAEPGPFVGFVNDRLRGGLPLATGRAVGVVEVALGLGGLALGGRVVPGLISLTYLLFTAVVAGAIRAGAPSCGCFGAVSSRPSIVHAAMNVGSTVVAAVAAVDGVPPMADGMSGRGLLGIVLTVVVLAAAGAVIFVDTR